jgi:hypothetical protein
MRKPRLSKLQDKPWEKMSDAQREKAWRELDRLGPRLEEFSRPLTEAERRRLKAMPTKAQYRARRRGRPKLGGAGAKYVLISIDPRLLALADALARKTGMSRSALFSQGVRMLLKAG